VFSFLRTLTASRRASQPAVLARSLDDAIAEAWHRKAPAWSATTAFCDPHARETVRAATPELSSLAAALREADDPDTGTLDACRKLLSDGFTSPLYTGDAEELRREAGRLRFRVLAVRGRG
jgi:hypothetical protein